VLGKALIAMRDNIKTSEQNLMQTSSNLMKRNQALEQYTFIVSHNLRAPVATILGLSELMNDEGMSPEDVKEMLGGLRQSAKKLDEVIHDLNLILEVKQQAHEIAETVCLPALINDIKQIFSKLLYEGDIIINCDFGEAEKITSIKSYLQSILYNLISNSIKYRRQEVQLLIQIKSYKTHGKTVIVYNDNGKGIDMEKNGKRIFGLYERFDRTVEGKGMGLYMMKTQVENLGGTISVESEVDKGTTFVIQLPDSLVPA
jgi:signal transduction histidine kinase